MAEASAPARQPGDNAWQAFRDPEAFVLRWHTGGQPYHGGVFVLLAGVAVLGTAAYGALIGAPAGSSRALDCALAFAGASALSWFAPLPAVYVLNSLSGARLRASTTFLAALVTAAWGGLGFFALLPIAALYLVAFSNHWAVLAAHLVALGFVAACMAAVYSRVQKGLEPKRGAGRGWWLWLFVGLQIELLYVFDVLRFSANP
jgi:hypothetical protein